MVANMADQEEADTLLTSTQAGALISRSGRTIVRWALAGRIPIAQQLPGPNGAFLFRESDVRAAIRFPDEQSA